MKLTWRDLDKLLWPTLAALTLLLLAALAAWLSHNDHQAARRQRDEAAAHQSAVEKRLRQARSEKEELKERAELFQRLQQAGVVGPEQRLEWTELLRDIQHRLRIPGLSYEFGARQPLDQGSDAYVWLGSPLRLQLRLAHEEDLLRLLDSLQREARALVLIRHCSLAPLANPDAGGDLAQLAAQCDLRWLTIDRSRTP